MWFSKHHYANELAKQNVVFFLNPPQEWSLQSFFRFGKTDYQEISKNLIVCSYSNFIPTFGKSILLKLNDYLIFRQLRKAIEKLKQQNSRIIFFSFNIFSLINPEYLKPDYSIFYSVDWYHHPNEFLLASKVDKIFVISQKMLNKLEDFAEKNSYIPHGIAEEVFEIEKSIKKNKVVFGGSIDNRVNLDLLLQLSNDFPQCSFYFAGKVTLKEKNELAEWDKLLANFNVEYLGVLAFSEMIKFFADSEICIAPYKNHFSEENVANLGSLKVYQYLALGKKVLSPFLAEFSSKETEGLITMYQNQEEAYQKFADLLNKEEMPKIIEQRVRFARKLSYSRLIEKMEESFK